MMLTTVLLLATANPVAAVAGAANPGADAASPGAADSHDGDVAIAAAVARDFAGWSVTTSTRGDLDGDGVDDVAAILARPLASSTTAETPFPAKEAMLVIYLAAKDPAHALRLKTKAPRAICVGCGGPKAVMGEPLGELEIKGGVLVVTYMGGSREEWQHTCRWRLPKDGGDDFVLIGETYSTYDTIGEEPNETWDANLSTLKIEHTVEKPGKKPVKMSCAAPASSKSQTLAAFAFEDRDATTLYACKKAPSSSSSRH